MSDSRSLDQIEKDIEDHRERLASTIDELAYRIKPANLARRQFAEGKSALYDATHTPDGEINYAVVGPAVGVAVLLVAVAIYRRVRD